MYVTDVTEENGPFQIIENSEKIDYITKDIKIASLKYRQNRLSESDVERLAENNKERVNTVIAEKGSVILVDTSAIHRGSPIKNGVRYALTNYYYPVEEINTRLFLHFSPNPHFTV
jgi:ectoine hydroxylase-related dioxygenase (phytanoyl-CoA dioxygenase family)